MNTVGRSCGRPRSPVPALLTALLAAVLMLMFAAAPGARAADGLDSAAQALRQGPVYVDPRAADRLPAEEARTLADTVEQAGKPVFVAVLPDTDEFDPRTLFRDLRTKVGITGVYVVALGDRFAARADSSVMSRGEIANLSGAVERSHPGDTGAMAVDFVDQAVRQADGEAPASWSGGDPDDGPAPGTADRTGSVGTLLAGVAVLAGFLVVVAGGLALVARTGQRRREAEEREQLEALRPVVDEDITAYGEELDRLDLSPPGPAADEAAREDYAHALDAYDRAKDSMAKADRPHDVRKVTEALEDGRFALATVEARRDGRPLPQRRPPCFFDPRHGPSVQDVQWAPPGGTRRGVPVCAADAARLADGEEPRAREVDTPEGRRPYWEAGPAYAPWAYGYFGGGMLPGLLMGTMLGGMLAGPHAYGYGYGYGGEGHPGDGGGGGGHEGGDQSGSDFGSGDFGGFGGGGFGGGGDFGGGFGGFG